MNRHSPDALLADDGGGSIESELLAWPPVAGSTLSLLPISSDAPDGSCIEK